MNRAKGLRAVLAGAVMILGANAAAADSFDSSRAGIEQLRAALDSGRVTSEQLVGYYLDRIGRYDSSGPGIHALISINPDVVQQARRLDADGRNKRDKGMLYGIPFIAKDNFDTAGIATSGGSAALKNSVPPTNAFIVQKLIDQGALLIGKANMSELAASYGRLSYSSAGGLTLNPYNTARNVSGSSSGSAAAVAADFAAFALGSDTSGSLRGPASAAGVVGMRPTLGLTSRSGVIPLSLTFDTTGMMARSVRDVAIVLDAVAAKDANDAATLQQPSRQASYLEALGAGVVRPATSLRGARLGVIVNFRGANAEVDRIERNALRHLRSQGAVLVPLFLPKEFDMLWQSVLGPVGEAEFKPQFERYLRSLRAAPAKTLGEFIELYSSAAMASSATPINPARLDGLRQADATQLTDSPAYIRILTWVIPALRDELTALTMSNRLQAWVFATMSCPASPRFDRADASYSCASDDPYKAGYIASALGFPEISVPAGRTSANLPVGLSFMGLPYSESRLFALAAAFELIAPPQAPPPLEPERR